MVIDRLSRLGFCCRIEDRCLGVAQSYTKHRPPVKLPVNNFIGQSKPTSYYGHRGWWTIWCLISNDSGTDRRLLSASQVRFLGENALSVAATASILLSSDPDPGNCPEHF